MLFSPNITTLIHLLCHVSERIAPPVVLGKKRPAEDPPPLEPLLANKVAAMTKPVAKKATSRREELLKQLKAVEDAIARKRSKI